MRLTKQDLDLLIKSEEHKDELVEQVTDLVLEAIAIWIAIGVVALCVALLVMLPSYATGLHPRFR
jgi:hypothetical protein